jgi:hypothetical protein
MANTGHESLTGNDLHEPKGVAAAAVNKVYVANGSGSGTWQQVAAAQLDESLKARKGTSKGLVNREKKLMGQLFILEASA